MIKIEKIGNKAVYMIFFGGVNNISVSKIGKI